MKNKCKTAVFRIFALLFLFAALSYPAADAAAEAATDSQQRTQLTIIQNGEKQELETAISRIEFGNELYTCDISPVLLKDCWMIPIQDVLADIMGIYCHIEEECIILKDPTGASNIRLTVNSDRAVINGKEYTLAMPVTAAENASGKDYLVPYAFIMDMLGFSHYVYEQKNEAQLLQYYVLQIASDYLYFQTAGETAYDAERYQNSLRAVTVTQNSSAKNNSIQGFLSKEEKADAVTVTQNAKNYYVTLHFEKTYDPFGKITKKIENGITESIEVWETEDFTTCIRVTYNKKYVYSYKLLANGGKITLSKGSFSMKVILPKAVSYNKVQTTDQYWKQQFVITIPGSYVSFYKKYQPIDNSSHIKAIKVSKAADGNTRLTIKTKGLKGYHLSKGTDCFTVKVGEPKEIYKNIILLDAGHGGKDSGAVSGSLKEKNLNLSIIYTRIKKYFDDKDSPVKAYWTRHDDTFINLYTRPTYSQKYQADLFISLHMNSASSFANGTEVYYTATNNKKSFSGITSRLFAKNMQKKLVTALGTRDRGVKQAGYVVTKYNTVPSILIELGFISGSSDRKKLKKASFQKKAAKTIYKGICDTFEKYPTKR